LPILAKLRQRRRSMYYEEQYTIGLALLHEAIAKAPGQSITGDDGITFGLTGPDWEPDDDTRYFAQRGGEFAFGSTAVEAVQLLKAYEAEEEAARAKCAAQGHDWDKKVEHRNDPSTGSPHLPGGLVGWSKTCK